MLKKVGQVAYKIKLPVQSKIHPVFHIVCLKKKLGVANFHQTELPMLHEDGRVQLDPSALLDQRMIIRNNVPVAQWLVHWSNSFPEDVTLADAFKIQQKFPEF